MSGILQKLRKSFNGTAISTFTVPALPVLFVSLDVNMNDSDSFILSFGSSPQYCHKLFSHNYHCILLN